jgi:hypothetical protein
LGLEHSFRLFSRPSAGPATKIRDAAAANRSCLDHRRPGYSHRRSSLVTLGMTTHVISDTVEHCGREPGNERQAPDEGHRHHDDQGDQGGEIVTQVRTAIL